MSIKTSSIYTSGNNAYFYSDRVKVFPCAYRNNKYDATARLNTEYNFTHLPHMIDKASYIIEFTEEKLICVIQGYYFEIELGDGNFATLNYNEETKKYKYLNICVASPNGAGSIESPHLCSWDKLSSIEGTLDIEQIGGTFFAGLKIGDGVLSNGNGYQCYALKLDASAALSIRASKIENTIKNKEGVENGTGKPISQEFTTDTLTANTSISTTSLNAKNLNVENNGSTILTAHSSGITANRAVQINSSLTSTSLYVINGSTPILKAWSEKVTINKPTDIIGTTNIKNSSGTATDGNLDVAGTGKFGGKLTVTAGGTDITGSAQIKKSSSVATDGNLTVAGRGSFGGELSVTADIATGTAFTIGKVQQQNSKQQDLGKLLCADVEVPLFVKNNLYVRGRNIDIGNTSSVPNITIYGIQPKSNDTSTFANGELLKIDQVTGKIAVYGLKDNEAEQEADKVGEIFSINPKTGETFANKINATVEGTSDKAINAENVTDTIKGTNITDIFGSTSNKIDRLKLRIIEPDTDATWDPGADQSVKIILKKDTDPVKTKAVSFFLAKGGTATVVKADEFIGVAETAQAFNFPATISLSGDINGTAESKYGWTIKTTINDSAVTKTKIKDGEVTNAKLAGGITNDKLVYDSITIGSTEVGLGGSVGDHESRRIGTLYGTRLNLSGDIVVNNIGNIKVNNASLKSSSLVKVDGSNVKLCDSALVVASNSVKICGSALSVTSDSAKIGTKLTIAPSSGNIVSEGTVEAASFNAKSDRRLKENIIDYKPEKSILDLPIKKFDFICGPKNQIGCIAQDLKEICPEIVNENEKGYLSIQESKLVYLLLDEVKKLKNEVEELKRK